MPELPEVELVARALDRHLRGRRVREALLLRPRLVPETTPEEFAAGLSGGRVREVGRRGKYILVNLESGLTLLVHLRMTGRFLLLPPTARELPKHTHALFTLDDGRRLAFADQRHFGLMKLCETCGLGEARELRSLAPEPFSEGFSVAYLASALARSRRTLKETLLDQTKVCGLGNIYAAEALHRARANPFDVAAEFPRRRVASLRRAVLEVLAEAIAHGSTLNVDPEDIESGYFGGGYGGRWRVYAREGEPCPRCRSAIERRTQGGRSTFFCPRCQGSA
ncbi:MAG TPA: bifunctional DNA-formamidopyrimidine glycosylase/DNA-(apurinic or apyrimidinic site) lyase [Pyrinomonadaceae bacterium]|nr:bifunctional DNA-formamidopyrimidine glycosylase/DNA-(apurinic or apyrimidinic site) lyase [Pyrinomonadaceae bacterium]